MVDTYWLLLVAPKLVTVGRLRVIEKIRDNIVAAHALEETIVEAVMEYANEDVSRAGFGLNAAFRASITLAKCSTMSDETRMAFAQAMFLELTDDLQTNVVASSQSPVPN